MSRIGKKRIKIPNGVTVTLGDKKISVKGKHGSLERTLLDGITVSNENNILSVARNNDSKQLKSFHGLTRALINNMVIGVNQRFTKILIAEGVGYRFQLNKNNLILNMGYSHPIEFIIPNDLEITLESPTKILISGIEKERVGFLASKVREVRPPEPYKGKGIRYHDEIILRKAGKTGK